MVRAIRFYQRALSPLTGPSCRFTPTCSEYAAVAIDRYGPLRGGGLAVRRIVRCNPLGGQGFDPVPDLAVGEMITADPSFPNTLGRDPGAREDLT